MVLGGGPGERLVRGVGAIVSPRNPLARLAGSRDLILLDQRGAGLSRPALECPELGALGPSSGGRDAVAPLARCAARLRAGNDLSAYSTRQNAADLDLVRQALGYERVNLLGVSYGARLAQEAIRGTPAWVRSAALVSPAPPGVSFVADGARSFARALARADRLCRAAARCRAQTPSLAASAERAVARLRRAPDRVTLRHRGRPLRLTVTAEAAVGAIFGLFYSPQGIQRLPEVVRAFERGDYSKLGGGGGGATIALTVGMEYSVLCQEDAARTGGSLTARARDLPESARVLAATSVVLGPPVLAVCRRWRVPPAPPARAARSDTPTLVATGDLDQITPPSYARLAARQLRNSTLVYVPGGGHAALLATGRCGVEAIDAYFDRPGRLPAGAGCLRPMRP